MTDIIVKKDGTPYATESSARQQMKAQGYTDMTHCVVGCGGGYCILKKPDFQEGDKAIIRAVSSDTHGIPEGTEVEVIDPLQTNLLPPVSAPTVKSPDGRTAWVKIENLEAVSSAMGDSAITLRAGDYVSTEGMSEAEYHAVAEAFMAAGAVKCERQHLPWSEWKQIGWCEHDGLYFSNCKAFTPDNSIRQLAIAQVLGATNAASGGQQQEDDDTPATTIDTLRLARDKRDEAAQALDSAEAVLSEAMDAVRAELGDGFELEERCPATAAMPAEDMSDPKKWKVGDEVEATVDNAGGFLGISKGGKHKVTQICGDGDVEIDDLFFTDEEAREQLKWLSRPTK